MNVAADERVERLRRFFETLSPATLAELDRFYTPDASFKDPFNEVTGTPAIRAIFEGMYRQLDAPRFVVTRTACDDNQGFLTWSLAFRWKGDKMREQMIRGATHIEFAADGRVAVHRDYWDAAEELYEKLPVLGSLMRFLKRRARH
jgi:steroid Delta-isomerase